MKVKYLVSTAVFVAGVVLAPVAYAADAPKDDAAHDDAAQGQGGADAAGQDKGAATGSDIIITANRRATVLHDTPLAVTAVGDEMLRTRNVSSLSDLATGTVPGIQIVPFAGTPSILAINARGIGLSDTTQGTQEMAVPLYIDGVPLGRAQGLGLDLIEPERIEFLRGPQGQLFGRNAEGGAIQFVSKRPSGVFGFDASVSYGNYDADRERLRVDLPEFANIRIQGAFVHSRHDPFTLNVPKGVYSDQADYGYLGSRGFRIAAEWSPFDALRVNYSYDDSFIKDSQPELVWVPVDINGRPPYSPKPAGDKDYPSVTNSPTFNEYFRSTSLGHGLTIQYDTSSHLTLKSISSYRQSSRHGSSTLGDALVAGGSSTGILRSNAREDIDQKQWYQEFQAIGTWDQFTLTVGASYFKEKVEDQRRSYLTGAGFTPPALGLSATLVNCIGLERCMTAHSEQHAQSDSYGFYAQGTYTPHFLDDKLELTAGLRYSDDTKLAVRTYIQPLALPPYLESSPSGALPPAATFKAKRWDPAFTVKYNFSSDVNAYVRYATAYRAGGANVRSSTFASYGAEEVKTWEIGLKSRFFDRKVDLNLAYFHNSISGYQSNIQESPTTNPSLTNTVNLKDPVVVSGIEAELNLRLVKGLTLSGSYTYMDAVEWVDFDNPLTVPVDITRFYSIQTPKHSGSVAVDYVTPSFGLGKIAFHLDYAFSSHFWTTPGGQLVASFGPTYSRPATRTNMMNGRLALQDVALGGAKAELAVFVKNLLDDHHYTYAFDGAGSGGGFAEYQTFPRTYGVELRVRY